LLPNISIFLADFSTPALKQKLAEDPLKYSRFLNGFSRLVREIVNLKEHRELSARQNTDQLQQLDPNRELNEKERDQIFGGVERAFGFKPGKPIGPPLHEILAKLHVAATAATEPPPTAEQPPSPALVPNNPASQPSPAPSYPSYSSHSSHPSYSAIGPSSPLTFSSPPEFCPRCPHLPAASSSNRRTPIASLPQLPLR
jgi:hypothetical protein